ncbi:hypothetical protein ACFL5E_02880 [Candidatus Omnitrophota bacterium]
MQKINKAVLIMTCFFIFACVFASPGIAKKKERWVKSKTGLKSLMQVANDRKAMEKQFSKETKSYDSIKKAIDSNELKEGMSARNIARRYGSPPISFPRDDGSGTKWVYKSGTQNFLDGADKVYLVFDESENLIEWSEVKRKVKEE